MWEVVCWVVWNDTNWHIQGRKLSLMIYVRRRLVRRVVWQHILSSLTGVKPYDCDSCGTKFTDMTGRNRQSKRCKHQATLLCYLRVIYANLASYLYVNPWGLFSYSSSVSHVSLHSNAALLIEDTIWNISKQLSPTKSSVVLVWANRIPLETVGFQ